MIAAALDLGAAFLLVAGGVLALLGAIGLVRFPDLYTRSHAASKAGTVGSMLAMLALMLSAEDFAVAMRAMAGVFFLFMTVPVAAHLLMRAAHKAGYPLWNQSVIDELPRL
jgi:multicomponent Na+:H+ antiporter subunit G